MREPTLAKRLSRALACQTNGSYIEEHPLWSVCGRTFQWDEAIARIPIDSITICVRDDAATSDFVGNSERNPEDFGNESMAEAFTRESVIHCMPGQQNQR